MQRLNIIYFGTPEFSAELLIKLISDTKLPIAIKAVVTQPDKKVGRKQIITPSPVKVVSNQHHIPVIDCLSSLSDNNNPASELFSHIDLVILFAYGKIIPASLLEKAQYGFWNVHPSLLPKYRGASPIAFPILMNEEKTGVTLMQMDELLDHGLIIEQQEIPLQGNETRVNLTHLSVKIAFSLLKKNLIALANGQEIVKKEQNHEKATFSCLLQKTDGFVTFSFLQSAINGDIATQNEIPKVISDYENKFLPNHPKTTPAIIVYRLFRSLFPWPGTWTMVKIKSEEKRLKITDVELQNGKLIIKKVQLEGKKEVDWGTFRKAYNI